jgi:broad specificity phosphatase PhoE
VTTFLLIRHGAHDLLGNTLAGRTRDISLNAAGLREAEELVARVTRFHIAAIHSSPRHRARETIAPLARSIGVEPVIDPGLDEIDFGRWSGRLFTELAHEPGWDTWCNARGHAQPPGGETIVAVQERIVATLRQLRDRHADATIALVTHGDVIKAALAHYLRSSLDDLERFDIAPASASVVVDVGSWSQVKLVNGLG